MLVSFEICDYRRAWQNMVRVQPAGLVYERVSGIRPIPFSSLQTRSKVFGGLAVATATISHRL